jgi:hypothetical protein
LSLWETDRVYPAWAFQPRIIAYLGFDPFTNTSLGSSHGNETHGVAFLLPGGPASIGQKIKQFRLKSRKTRWQLAAEWGVSPKTLWGWETDRGPKAAIGFPIEAVAFADGNGSDSTGYDPGREQYCVGEKKRRWK